MALVTGDVHDQLVTDLLQPETGPCHLCLEDDLLRFQEEIHPGGFPSVAGSPFLWSDIVEKNREKSMQQVLDVILIVDLQRFPLFMAHAKLAGHAVKLADNVQNPLNC